MEQSNLITQMLKQSTAKDGTTLFDHLARVLSALPMHSAGSQLPTSEHFEMLSDFVKKSQFKHKELPSQERITEMTITNRTSKYPWVADAKLLHKNSSQIKEQAKLILSNFTIDNRILTWAGMGFDSKTAEQIHQSVKKLAASVEAKRMRFWGKIMTSFGDYYVAQGVSGQPNNSDLAPAMERQGEGANYYSYWVSHNYLGDWIELPLITPQQLRGARQIKQIMTGNLEAIIPGYPTFPGKQKHYLKAQLVRITHACEIAPKGQFAGLEENPDEIDFAEEFKMPDVAELTNLENWVHLNPYLLQQGRSTYYIDPSLPEEQKQQLTAELAEKDPKLERLKGINEDKPPEGSETLWLSKIIGDPQVFNNVGKEEGTTSCYALCSLKNPSWPGWLTVGTSKQYASIYIGYGIKSQQQLFFPIGPSDLNEEGEDVEEFGEPNPRNPPDEIEPDSDEEAKKEQA